MNCEHETLVGDNDLFQMLMVEYAYIKHGDLTGGVLFVFEEHLEEYLPKMSDLYALQVINFILSELKTKQVKLDTTGLGDFYYLNNIERWNKIKNTLITQKDAIMAIKEGEEENEKF